MIRKPGRWLDLYAALVWLLGPVACINYYSAEQRRVAFPMDGDSIGVPIMAYITGWAILSIVVIIVRIGWKRISKRRVWSSVLIGILAAVWGICKLLMMKDMLSDRIFFNAAYDASWIILCACIVWRALVMVNEEPMGI